jgi:hypothetical protein
MLIYKRRADNVVFGQGGTLWLIDGEDEQSVYLRGPCVTEDYWEWFASRERITCADFLENWEAIDVDRKTLELPARRLSGRLAAARMK